LEPFVADIFHEVDEEVRREQLKKLWDKYSLVLIAAAVLFVAAVAGWRGYEYYVGKKAAEAGAQFEAALSLVEQGKQADAEAAFTKIVGDAPQGYRVLSRFQAASALARTKQADGVKAFDDLAADTSLGPIWQDLAGVRAGLLLVDTAPLADVQKRLDPLAEPGRPYRHTARELLALSAWKNKDAAATKRYIDMISADAETPQSTRSRVDVLSALIAGNGKS
jgi:hypothetical protein